MATSNLRRPRSTIQAMSSSIATAEEGIWDTMVYRKLMWVTMQPSTRGAHKVSRRHVGMRSHLWKGRILDFKQTKDGKKLVRIQHVYTAGQLTLDDHLPRRFPANHIFPSNFLEWEPIEALTGAFEAIHSVFGAILYAGCLPAKLVDQGVFFYDATYIVPKANGKGSLEPIVAPTIRSGDWPINDFIQAQD